MADISPPSPPPSALDAARAEARNGNHDRARRLLQEITRDAPHNVDAWLWRARVAETTEEKIVSLSRILQLSPQHAQAGRLLHEALRQHLEEDAFLAYERESHRLYYIRTAGDLAVTVPKQRAVPAPYPPPEPSPLQPATRWLGWALLGLLPAGLGAVVCAPLAIRAALRTRRHALPAKERLRSQIVLGAASLLFVLGLALALLFLLHL